MLHGGREAEEGPAGTVRLVWPAAAWGGQREGDGEGQEHEVGWAGDRRG